MAKSSVKKQVQQDFFLRDTFKKENECWSSSLFHDVFIRNDMGKYFKEFKQTYDNKGYERFLVQLKNIVRSLGDVKINGEDNTVEKVIVPIMSALGWIEVDPLNPTINKNYGTKLNIRNDKGEKGEKGELDFYITEDYHDQIYIEEVKKKNSEAFKRAKERVIFNVEAKAWGELQAYKVGKEFELVDKGLNEIRGSALTPPQQACKYMQMMDFDFTILSDGNTWQLLNKKETLENPKRVYEFDFGKMKGFINQLFDDDESAMVSWDFIADQARYFYYMFSKDSLYSKKGKAPVDRMLEESSKYAKEVQEDLKLKFLDSMNIVCNAFGKTLEKEGYNLKDEETRDLVRGTGENFLFTLLFIKSLESRNILNTNIPDYENPYSLKYVINSIDPQISRIDPEGGDEFIEAKLRRDVFTKRNGFKKEFSFKGFELYERVLSLIDIVEKGKFGFSIDEFTKSIFSTKEKRILKNFKINNRDMFHVFFNFGFATRNNKSKVSERYAQIPYDYFAPRELGSIYESFLEFKLEYASKPTFFNTKKKQWQDIEGDVKSFCKRNKIKQHKVIPKKSLYFRPDNKDRLMSGSYYTPDDIVRYIVENTMGEICNGLDSDEILSLSVCDPAMGSAHFLVDSLIYLTNRYREKLIEEQSLNENYPESINKVLHHCIYGADINDRAVKLAKFSLWLSTASTGISLEPLNDQLTVCNSLSMKDMLKSAWSEKVEPFTFIVGNPPWGAKSFSSKDLKANCFKDVELKNINTFDLFTRLAIDILDEEGAMGFLIPRNVLRGEAYSSLREFMLPGLSKVIETGKFPGVTQEACAIVYSANGDNDTFKVDNSLIKKMSNPLVTIEKDLIESPFFKYQVNKSTQFDSIVDKVRKGNKFSSYYNVKRGIECGKSGELVCCPNCGLHTSPPKKKNKKGEFNKNCSDCGEKITLDNDVINMIGDKTKQRKLEVLAGPDVKPHEFSVQRWLIPNLKGIQYKEELASKGDKLYIPKNNDKIFAAHDPKGGKFATQTLYVCQPKKKDIKHKQVASILNSKLFRFYHEYTVNNGGNLTNAIPTSIINSLPIITNSGSDKILSDKEVYNIYKLNDSEIKSVDEFVASLDQE